MEFEQCALPHCYDYPSSIRMVIGIANALQAMSLVKNDRIYNDDVLRVGQSDGIAISASIRIYSGRIGKRHRLTCSIGNNRYNFHIWYIIMIIIIVQSTTTNSTT
jgi:hypothetical protein